MGDCRSLEATREDQVHIQDHQVASRWPFTHDMPSAPAGTRINSDMVWKSELELQGLELHSCSLSCFSARGPTSALLLRTCADDDEREEVGVGAMRNRGRVCAWGPGCPLKYRR
jgi:hypothetical protein